MGRGFADQRQAKCLMNGILKQAALFRTDQRFEIRLGPFLFFRDNSRNWGELPLYK